MSTTPRARQSLSIDFDTLFPGDAITIGTQSIVIRPLNLEQLTTLTKQVKGLIPKFAEENITLDNFNNAESIVKMIPIIFDNAPFILEEASNISLDDLKKLPMDVIIQIVDKVVEVNLKSKGTLEKNFKSLISKFVQPTPKKDQKKD